MNVELIEKSRNNNELFLVFLTKIQKIMSEYYSPWKIM